MSRGKRPRHCGHILRGVLASVDKIDGVEASSANYTGTMIRISVSRASDRDKVAEGVHKVLTEGDRKAVPLAGVEFKRALDREAWRGTGRIGELSAIEFHTLVLHRVKTFAKGEKLGKEAADKLVTIAERQWERISKEARSDGATQPEEWANRCRKSLPVLLERANEFLTGEQVDRLKQTLTGPCRDQDRPEAAACTGHRRETCTQVGLVRRHGPGCLDRFRDDSYTPDCNGGRSSRIPRTRAPLALAATQLARTSGGLSPRVVFQGRCHGADRLLSACRARPGVEALRSRGLEYAWHKVLRRSLRNRPAWKRRLLYADPRRYWTLRGGDDYFREQEGQEARSLRADWIAERLAAYRPTSILEVGCGYGKLLAALRSRLDIPLAGIDFSPTQLGRAQGFLRPGHDAFLILSRGECLPFADQSFDMVVTSAVILHNPPEAAARIRRELIRVGRRFAAHNEETDSSYNRYGYDTAAWYRARGVELAESGSIPMDTDPTASQFCVALLGSRE